MNDFSSIKVLWVDDDPDLNLKKIFEKHGLRVTVVTDHEKGIEELNAHKKEWDFVLLDGRGTDRSMAKNKVTGTARLLSELDSIKRTDRDIPHCIYTAYIKEEEDKAELRAFDKDVTFIPKGSARSIKDVPPIIGYIKKHAALQYETQICNLYSDVFDSAKVLNLSDDDVQILKSSLLAMTYAAFRSICPKANELRVVIEDVCRELSNYNLIPKECWKIDGTGNKTEINLTDCVTYLSGNRTKNICGKPDNLGVFDSGQPILGEFLGELMEKALNFTQMGSHGKQQILDPAYTDINRRITYYTSIVPSPLYIFSALLVICDFIKVAANVIKSFPDVVNNSKRCLALEAEFGPLNQQNNKFRTAPVTVETDGTVHIGTHVEVRQTYDFQRNPILVTGSVISFSERIVELNRDISNYRFFIGSYQKIH